MTPAVQNPLKDNARRPVVLTLLGAYWPGNESSGPNQSFRALADALRGEFEFKLVARDRPFGAAAPLAPSGRWIDLGFASARYCDVDSRGAAGLRGLLRETPHDILWMNGFFDREFTLPALALRRAGLVPRTPALLSPRGEFGAGALGLKTARKQFYLSASRRLGLLGGVRLHATSEAEAGDFRAGLPWHNDIAVAPNVRALIEPPLFSLPDSPALRVAFVGRISPVKNLHVALGVLKTVTAPVAFNIFGPAQDEAYWLACRAQISDLPAHVRVAWHGETANDAVIKAMARTDLFFLPTAGENFGHAIFEALSCGVPVLISDRAPWRGLQARGAGWDLPLEDPTAFARAIDAFAAMPQDSRAALRAGARAAAEQWLRDSGGLEKNKAMLRSAIGAAAAAPGKKQ